MDTKVQLGFKKELLFSVGAGRAIVKEETLLLMVIDRLQGEGSERKFQLC